MKYMMVLVLLMNGILSGCAEEKLYTICTSLAPSFDIESVSSLEDTWGWEGVQDAVALEYAPARTLAKDATWRVSGVDVLILIPVAEFDNYPEDVQLTLTIHERDDPSQHMGWSLEQTLIPASLTWEDVTMGAEPTGLIGTAGSNLGTQFKKAWWSFDFSDVIPEEEGMANAEYSVSIHWSNQALPLIGYSRLDRPCNKNWTNYDLAEPPHPTVTAPGWDRNDLRFGDSECNWPMLKVSTELRERCES